jgi:Phosphomannose isomerase type I.
MAGSDNVVRACFTSKLIDKETLCEVIVVNIEYK